MHFLFHPSQHMRVRLKNKIGFGMSLLKGKALNSLRKCFLLLKRKVNHTAVLYLSLNYLIYGHLKNSNCPIHPPIAMRKLTPPQIFPLFASRILKLVCGGIIFK